MRKKVHTKGTCSFEIFLSLFDCCGEHALFGTVRGEFLDAVEFVNFPF